jgi:hypothetical protein
LRRPSHTEAAYPVRQGGFFEFSPARGSFECNPPFVPNLMLKVGVAA